MDLSSILTFIAYTIFSTCFSIWYLRKVFGSPSWKTLPPVAEALSGLKRNEWHFNAEKALMWKDIVKPTRQDDLWYFEIEALETVVFYARFNEVGSEYFDMISDLPGRPKAYLRASFVNNTLKLADVNGVRLNPEFLDGINPLTREALGTILCNLRNVSKTVDPVKVAN